MQAKKEGHGTGMQDLAKTLKALSDGTRLKILALLAKEGELCVCDIEEVLDISQSKSSRHLRYLLNAGILQERREAVWVYYRLSKELSAGKNAIIRAVIQSFTSEKLGDLEKRFSRWKKSSKRRML